MSIYQSFIDSKFMCAMRGEMDDINTLKGASSLMTIPDITEENCGKYLGKISFYDYNVKYDNTYSKHIDRIMDIFYDNIHRVKFNPRHAQNMEYNGYKVHICNGVASLATVEFKVSDTKYSLIPSRIQIAKFNFLIQYLLDKDKKEKDRKLDKHLNLKTSYKSHRLKGGILKMTEQEVLDSLLETHPQHFI